MGVIQKNLYVDGINLANYGLYVTGQSVYNAPQRDVELVAIPGRNGDYIIDNGRFQNIEVTYPAGLREDTTDFATRVAEIRNILASRHRYVRIEDDYNPDEYREGMFVSGLEVTPACDNIAGQFDLVFNCKPQRFLKSGETAVSVASGGTITNPTLFESKPLIEIKGSGELSVNGYGISVPNVPIGNVSLASSTNTNTQTFSENSLEAGDTITVGATTVVITDRFSSSVMLYGASVDSETGTLTTSTEVEGVGYGVHNASVVVSIPATTFAKGTSATKTSTIAITYTKYPLTTTFTATYTVSMTYTSGGTIQITTSTSTTETIDYESVSYTFGAISAYSTQSSLGNPMYIDCELGDCYKYESGTLVLVNSSVSFVGGKLPVLSAGSNTITYDNTITSFKITPRWWQI